MIDMILVQVDSPVDLVLHAVSNPIRRATMINLRETEMRFSQLLAACGLNYDHNVGHFAYHLSEFIKRRIVENALGPWQADR